MGSLLAPYRLPKGRKWGTLSRILFLVRPLLFEKSPSDDDDSDPWCCDAPLNRDRFPNGRGRRLAFGLRPPTFRHCLPRHRLRLSSSGIMKSALAGSRFSSSNALLRWICCGGFSPVIAARSRWVEALSSLLGSMFCIRRAITVINKSSTSLSSSGCVATPSTSYMEPGLESAMNIKDKN